MILTQCAVCATELGLSLGKKCGRCSTRYCGPECQVQHWKEGSHDQLCKQIKRSGGAEQYNANQKYTEAVTRAAEACADDTKGQTCYICTQALHWKTKEGLVRGCSCRGTAGFAHVACLAEQVKILVAEAEENNFLGSDKFVPRWARWYTCSLCEQDYHTAVRCALGWACWKTYLGRSETDKLRRTAMNLLGGGLYSAEHHADAASVMEAELSMMRRIGGSDNSDIFVAQTNLASTYQALGRLDQAMCLRREAYAGGLKLFGEEDNNVLSAANNYAKSLLTLKRSEEAKALLRKTMPVARRVLREEHRITLKMRWNYALALCCDPSATLDDVSEGVSTLEDAGRIARRVLGGAHPTTEGIENALRDAGAALAAREGDCVTSVCEAVAAVNLLDGS